MGCPFHWESGINCILIASVTLDVNVPIPVVVPMDTNGYWVVYASFPSQTVNNWWIALVSPIETLILLFIVETTVELIPDGESPT